jgi:predicted DNA-binding protein
MTVYFPSVMPRPRSEKTGPAVNLRIGDDLMAKLKQVADITKKPLASVIREAMEIGLADWALTGYQGAELIAKEAAEIKSRQVAKTSSERDIALLAEKTSQYRTGKKGSINVRNAAAPLPTYLVMRKGYILEPLPKAAKTAAESQPS